MNKSTILVTLAFICIMGASGCHDNMTPLPRKILRDVGKIEIFGDSTYFHRIDGIHSWGNTFYLLHSEANRIIMLDTALNYVNSFGEKGKGPGQFVYPTDVVKWKDDIYISDPGKTSISIFRKKDSNYLYRTEFKASIHSLRDFQCFTICNEKLYIVTPHNERPFKILSVDGAERGSFGENVEVKTKHYFRHLFYIDSNPEVGVVAISQTEPILFHYDFEGNLLNKVDLSELDILQATLHRNNEYYKNADLNSAIDLFSSVTLKRNKLYLKLELAEDDDYVNCRNKVLVLSLDNGAFKPERILELGNSLVSAFSVNDDNSKLIAYDGILGELLIFNL